MDNQVKVNGLTFVPYITGEEIAREVQRVAGEIREDYKNVREPLFLCVLNGAFVFAADLFRSVEINDAKINFVRYTSYCGTESTGVVKQLIGVPDDVEGRDVIIIEDIVDTGFTAVRMVEDLKARNPHSIRFCTLLYKPESSKTNFKPDYAAFVIPPKFIIGYGLDLDGKARNLRDIYVIKED